MTIDQQLLCYKRLPNWTATTLPEMVTQKHNTKVGTWAKLTILSGALYFYELDEEGQVTAEHLFTPETDIPFCRTSGLAPHRCCFRGFRMLSVFLLQT